MWDSNRSNTACRFLSLSDRDFFRKTSVQLSHELLIFWVFTQEAASHRAQFVHGRARQFKTGRQILEPGALLLGADVIKSHLHRI